MSKVMVVGSGQMGSGIAQVAAQSGHSVLLCDLDSAALEKAKAVIEKSLTKLEEKGKLSEAAHAIHSRIEHSSDLSAVKGQDVGIVIEAVTENIEIKAKVFQSLEEVLPESCIFASNTSSISITELAARVRRPENFVGMHFMNPVPIMALVEIIRGLGTSDETLQFVEKLAQKMGKTTVLSKDMPGFIVNRILMPMINEACYALQDGLASVEDIDTAMKLGTNQPMGPLTLADFIGLDTCLYIMNVLHDGFADTKYRPCPLLKQYVAAGRLGRKSGRGFYDY